MKHFHLHLISDSTGETVSSVSRASLAQFEDIDHEEHIWSLVRTKTQMEKVLTGIAANPGVVMYTLADEEIRNTLQKECMRLKLPCINVIGNTVKELGAYLQMESSAQSPPPSASCNRSSAPKQVLRGGRRTNYWEAPPFVGPPQRLAWGPTNDS